MSSFTLEKHLFNIYLYKRFNPGYISTMMPRVPEKQQMKEHQSHRSVSAVYI